MRFMRFVSGVMVGLVLSMAVAYGLLLQAISLGFDGPSSLTPTLVSARYERGSVILTSNKGVGEWASSLPTT